MKGPPFFTLAPPEAAEDCGTSRTAYGFSYRDACIVTLSQYTITSDRSRRRSRLLLILTSLAVFSLFASKA